MESCVSSCRCCSTASRCGSRPGSCPASSGPADWLYLLLAGLVFGLINLIVKPIVTFFSLPLIVVTLGLFFLVINALMLYLAAYFLDGLTVDGFVAALLGGLVIALFNWALRAFGG